MKLLRLFRTLRYVPPEALAWRVWARAKRRYYSTPLFGLRSVWDGASPAKPPLLCGVQLVPGKAAVGEALATGHWVLAGKEEALGLPPRDWLPARLQPLQTFDLHYHEWLADLRAANQPQAARALLADWLVLFGHYHPTVWHPYPTSLRVVAWLTHGSWLLAEADDDLQQAFYRTLAAQVYYLRHNAEWDLGGNHLIKNLKASLMGAVALSDTEMQLWAEQHLIAALRHQILPDGAHDERTPHYHTQVLQDVLEVRACLRAAGLGGGGLWDDCARNMGAALAFYTYPDGALGLWNDSVEGDPARVQALLQESGFTGEVPATLPNAGYARLQAGSLGLVFDGGPVGPNENPGHAHADTLALELWCGTQRVVVNGGTLAYQHKLRGYFRGTSAHSTLGLVGKEGPIDSAEVWTEHRVGRRAEKVGLKVLGAGQVTGWHDGYKHLGVTHTRSLTLTPTGLTGIDSLSGKGAAGMKAWVRFHLHPSIKVQQADDTRALLTLPSGQQLQFICIGGRVTVQPSRYAPQFNQPQAGLQLAIRPQGAQIEWQLTLVPVAKPKA